MPRLESRSQQRVEHSLEHAGAGPGRYVSDGTRLFRVISTLDPLLGEPAELEDCKTLEVRHYTPDELLVMRLRPVLVNPD